MVRNFLLSLILFFSLAGTALAEGFNMSEWSARGLSLAGGLVGRADDVSALAYNAAGITQLPGTHFMMGASTITPYGDIKRGSGLGTRPADVNTWTPAHFYLSHQLNDSVWLGLATFTRFGLGNSYPGNWFGRYNMYDVGLQTMSFVPTIAYKINDIFSVSAGVELMYIHMYMGQKIPSMFTPGVFIDNDMQLEGQGWGIGGHLGVHAKLNDQWSIGFAYKSQVVQRIDGDVNFGQQANQLLATLPMQVQRNTSVSGVIVLPDSFALGVAYKPLPNLSFELGTVFVRWSSYKSLDIRFSDPINQTVSNRKQWNDGWNFNASVEYKPVDWLALRAGYWRETPVVNERYADFMVPSYGRDVMTLGAGVKWNNWTVDVAYAHIWIHSLDYGTSRTNGVGFNAVNAGFFGQNGAGPGGKAKNCQADMFVLSIGYSF